MVTTLPKMLQSDQHRHINDSGNTDNDDKIIITIVVVVIVITTTSYLLSASQCRSGIRTVHFVLYPVCAVSNLHNNAKSFCL